MIDVIVWAFVIAGAVTFFGVAFFLWLNAKDSSIDDRAYDEKFDPGSLVTKYQRRELSDEDRIDPAAALKAYAQRGEPEEPPTPQPATATPQQPPSPSPSPLADAEVVDAEIIQEAPPTRDRSR